MAAATHRSTFLAISGVYVGQSLLGGVTFQAVPALLRSAGGSLGMIGLTGMAMVPWALKFLWAPVIERYRRPAAGERRSKRVLAAGQATVVICLILIAVTGPYEPPLLLVLLIVAATASATADIAADAYCIEQVGDKRRGIAASVQIGSSYVGMVAGAGGLLLFADRFGWRFSFFGAAAVVALLSLPFMAKREHSRSSDERPHRPSLAYALRRPEVRTGIMVTILFQAGMRLAQGLSGPLLVDAGMDLSTVGLLGILAAAAGLAGSWAGGTTARRLGERRALLVGSLCQLASLLAWAAAAGGNMGGITPPTLFLAFNFVAAFGFVVLYANLMGWSSPLQIGVDYTIFQCIDGLVAALMAVAGGLIAEALGFVGGFAAACALSLLAAVALLFLIPSAHREARA